MNTQEIETAVSQALADAGITYRAEYAGECIGAFGDDKTVSDAWRVTFRQGLQASETFDFFTGIGLRKQVHRMPTPAHSKGTVGYEGWKRYAFKPQAPSAASVLHCLFLDSSALETSFDYWCDDFGYDTDSRKALETYTACCENAKRLFRVIPAKARETLRELLQDY
jgi:hypothetical protein